MFFFFCIVSANVVCTSRGYNNQGCVILSHETVVVDSIILASNLGKNTVTRACRLLIITPYRIVVIEYIYRRNPRDHFGGVTLDMKPCWGGEYHRQLEVQC